MGKQTYDFKNLNGKMTNVQMEVADNQPKSKAKDVSFLGLYGFANTFEKTLLWIGLLASVSTGILQPLNVLIFGNLTGAIIEYASKVIQHQVDEDATNQFLEEVRDFAIYNSLIGFGMLIFNYISVETFNFSSLKQIFKIRTLYFKNILNQDISWYDMNGSGDFASRMLDDLSKLEEGIGEKVPIFITFQCVFLASLVQALYRGWELALICLISLPLSMFAIGIIAFLSSRLAKKEMDAYASAGVIAEEVLSSIRTVVAFGGEQKESERYDVELVKAKNNNLRKALMSAVGYGLLWFFIYSSYALAFWYGVKLVLRDRKDPDPTYTPANMVVVFFSVMTGTMNFGISSPFVEAFSNAKAAGSKIYKVIGNTPVINLSKNVGHKIEKLSGNIKFNNVKFHYPSRKAVPILKGLSFEIKTGETVALVGSSGCGKSTCIQLIQRFYDPTEGEVILDGHNLKDLDLTWLRKNIGVVGQEPVLFATSILENIRLGKPTATKEEVEEAARRANAHRFICALPQGYDTMVGERGTQLSGGQKQRIAIARALVRDPVILLLDEATSALDNASEARVQAAIESASKERTTVIVAHRLSTIRQADKIIVLSEGRVVEQGDHDTLMAARGEYYALVTAQVQDSDEKGDRDRKQSVSEGAQEEDDEEAVEEETTKSSKKDQEVYVQKPSVWTIIKMNSEEWPQLLIGCIGAVIMGCAMPAFAVLFGSILGTLADPNPDHVERETNKYCFYFVLAGLIAGLSTFSQIYLFSIAGEKLTMRVRSKMFRALLRQEMGYYDKKENGVGALCAKLSGEAAQVQGATGQRLGTILQSLATLGLAIGLSMFYEWRLGLVALAFTPFLLVSTFLERRQSRGADDSQQFSLQKSTKVAVEAVGNIKTVASLGCEEKFYQLFVAELGQHIKKSLRLTHTRSIILGISRSLMFFAYAACMYYGGFLIRDGLPYENVFKVSQALIMGTTSVANAFAFTPNLQKGIVSAKKIMKLLNRVPKVRDIVNPRELDTVTGTVDYKGVHFAYPTRASTPVLQGLDLRAASGLKVALVGPSGCGKSTVLQLLLRAYDPTGGQVELDEVDVRELRMHWLRKQLGVVAQEPNLFNRTIAENIAYGDNSRDVSREEIISAARKANIHDFVSNLPLGYETSLGEKATQLSGGQKQRIAIARALLRDPKVLLLDEATSALDTESEKVVQEALDKAKEGRTCITIAHRLSTIQDADVICVINEGRVVEMGTHSELLEAQGVYYRLQKIKLK